MLTLLWYWIKRKVNPPAPNRCPRCGKEIRGMEVYLDGYGVVCDPCDSDLAALDGHVDRNRS